MKFEEARFRLTGTAPILGSVALDEDTYSNYIVTKAETEEEKARAAEDAGMLGGADGDDEDEPNKSKVTGFYKDPVTGAPRLMAYQVRGFLKSAGKALASQIGLVAPASKIDNFVFVPERYIPFKDSNGNIITTTNGILSRSLRAETMKGPRVGLAFSEKIDEWSIEFNIRVLENNGTKKSVPLTMDVVRELLEYGQYCGLLQWRNGGYGAFTFEEIRK